MSVSFYVFAFVLPDPGSELLRGEISAHSRSYGNDCIT